MRKLTLALLTLACLTAEAGAQQAPTYNIGNFPATQAVSQSGTWTFGLSGPIPSGTNVIGAVTQSGGPWSVSGTVSLGAGSAQIGTIGNAFALDATLTSRLGTLGQKAAAGSAPVVLASDQSLPLPAGAATASNQSSEIAALGAPADAAYTGTGNASSIAALKGIYAGLLAPTPAGTNTIGSLANITGTISLPTGAATSALQTTGNTALGSPADAAYAGSGNASLIAALKGLYAGETQRAVTFSDLGPGTLGASTPSLGATHDAGASPSPYTRFNATVSATAAVTVIIQGSDDASGWYDLTNDVTTAPATNSSYNTAQPSVRITFRYYRVKVVTGGVSSTLYAKSSFTFN